MQKKYFTTSTKNRLVYCLLDNLVPEKIKQDYSDNLNKEVITRTQYLNEISNLLCSTTWSNYIYEFENDLKPFMEKNGLINYEAYRMDIFDY